MHNRNQHSTESANCHSNDDRCESVGRREFIKLAAASLSAASPAARAIAGPFNAEDVKDHFVPADKKLDPAWVKSLFAKGKSTVYSGSDLKTIAMPVGGIGAGQVYLTGDGRLTHWDIFNDLKFTGYGRTNYDLGWSPQSPLQQGFGIHVTSAGQSESRTLDGDGFSSVKFCGEYPIGTVEYQDDDSPVAVTRKAFSPFIPLNAADSALPATVMRFTLKNTSNQPAEVTLGGWLENGASFGSSEMTFGKRRNRVVRRDGMTMILGSAEAIAPPAEPRQPVVFEDFEGDDYGDWAVEGQAFGAKPPRGTLEGQQEVSGFQGAGLVNTFLGGDDPHGKLTSPSFTIERSFINFLIGGGRHAGRTCVNLLVDGKPARTAAGVSKEELHWRHWNVRELEGKQARIEIVDQESGGWGHINIDQIEFDDKPQTGFGGKLEEQADFGTMGLVILDDSDDLLVRAVLADGQPTDVLFADQAPLPSEQAEKEFGVSLVGALGKRCTLQPGEQVEVIFLVTWCFPNRAERGNFYATRFADAAEVAGYIAENFSRLADQTQLWHDTWYNSTLPHWLLDRLFSTVSTLATSTCQWWANGRFWAFEGVGCCHGTCTHVWNYEHSMARLFPRLERSAREMQDFNPQAGFDEATGMVRFRGEGWNNWAADGQAGTVLKAYREHQMSVDDAFLRRNWPPIRKTLEFLINQDADSNGLLEGSQHNTYDINFEGPNPMMGSLYLAALRAGERMALELGQGEFADTCRKLFESGGRLTIERLFNGEYFIQEVDLEKFPKFQTGIGCLADQIFGQGWAHQVGLGYVYPKENIDATLESIWKYNWAPDVGPQNEAHLPERWFASPGEAGLFTCTWPRGEYITQGVRYKNEVWTGIEYQVAGNMAYDGMVTEALAICRGIHERYHPAKHNPWNEVECGDHYARGMASHGVFLGLCGFEYHGPRGHIGFAPRIAPDDFRAAFTAAQGWGTISQLRTDGLQTARVELKWGSLMVKTLALETFQGSRLKSVTVAGRQLQAEAVADGGRVLVTLSEPVVVKADESLEVTLTE